jgi:hypothetical protein
MISVSIVIDGRWEEKKQNKKLYKYWGIAAIEYHNFSNLLTELFAKFQKCSLNKSIQNEIIRKWQ